MNLLFIIGKCDVDTVFYLVPPDSTNISILFIDKGVGFISRKEIVDHLEYADLYALKRDFSEVDDKIKQIDYNGWMNLLVWANRIVSWT